jgi:hypothetical protein
MTGSLRWLGFLPLVLASAPAGAIECADFLRMHGFLRRAQATCAFERFNPEIVDTARQCYERLGAGVGAPAIRGGAEQFDRMASLRGAHAACVLVERRFPMVVR